MKFIRPLAKAAIPALLGLALSTHALADTYRVKIKKIGPESATGDVIIQVRPGNNENGFTGRANVMLVGTDPGTNRVMATLLTAVSLSAEVIIDVANPPSIDDIQVTTKVTLIVP